MKVPRCVETNNCTSSPRLHSRCRRSPRPRAHRPDHRRSNPRSLARRSRPAPSARTHRSPAGRSSSAVWSLWSTTTARSVPAPALNAEPRTDHHPRASRLPPRASPQSRSMLPRRTDRRLRALVCAAEEPRARRLPRRRYDGSSSSAASPAAAVETADREPAQPDTAQGGRSQAARSTGRWSRHNRGSQHNSHRH